MKPIIGVMPLWDDEKESIWMLPGYLDGIKQAGGTPFVFPFLDEEQELSKLVSFCNGILLTGGHDVHPHLYGEKQMEPLVTCCEKRDVMESIVLSLAIKANKSVLGICRGIQLINVAMGGTLFQDLPLQHPSIIEHHQMPPYNIPVHEVKLITDSPLREYLGKETIMVNSYHHQAVKELAQGLEVMAVSSDGLIEAIYAPDQKYLWAVQWHPEYSYQVDNNSRLIFKSFIDSLE